jgi:hypothetical protein
MLKVTFNLFEQLNDLTACFWKEDFASNPESRGGYVLVN